MEVKTEKKSKWSNACSSGGQAVYGLGMIGIFIYYLQNAATFMDGVLGLVKAVFWPAFLLHKIYTLLGM